MKDVGDYISREAEVDRLEKLFQLQSATARAIIEAIPAADVRPVVRGKWVYNDGDNIPYCSECMMPQDSECNFCPSCGADMRDKEDADHV